MRFSAAAIVAIGIGAINPTAQSPRFATRVEAVRVDVLVSDNGKPVRGLTAADFEVRDNGVLQAIDHASFEQVPLSVVLTLDVSHSVAGARLDHLLEASRAVLDALKHDDQAALITVSRTVTAAAKLTRDIQAVRAALPAAAGEEDTALIDGAYAGTVMADSSAGRGLLIVFSDGSDTASWLTEQQVVDVARRSEAVVYAVAAGAKQPSLLRDLTAATGGRLYEVESTRNLRAVFISALEEFRQRYLLSYTPRGVSNGGWHKLEVRLKGRRGQIRARPGYGGS